MKQKCFKEQKSFRFKRFVRKAYSAFNSMHRVVSIGVVSGCMLTFAHAGASAQTVASEQQPSKIVEKELDEVTVIASQSALPLGLASKMVTVVTQSQIAAAPVHSIQDLLVYIAGIDVVQRGAHGVQADISIRGGLSDQTAVLLNGIDLTNSQTGHYSLDIPVNLSDIERIEIIQGPSSLIYGTSAFSGVINIITKKQSDTKGYIRLMGGMHDLYEVEVRGSAEVGNTSHQLSFGYNTSGGYVANSDYDIYNALWQSRIRLKNESNLDFQLGYNNKKFGANTFYSAAYPNQYERTDTYLSSIKGEFGTKLKVRPAVYWTRHHDRFDLIKNTTTGRNYHRNDMYGTNLNLEYTSVLGTTSMGGELRKEEILSSKLGNNLHKPHGAFYTKYDSRTNSSIALEHIYTRDKMTISAGGLLNHNTVLKDAYRFYPSIGLSYQLNSKIKLSTSWSKATRMPSFTDLYYTTETHIGNDGLRPEKSESIDLSVKYRNRFMTAYINGYLMWGRDMIDWVRATPTDKWASWNHTSINKRGVEIGAKFYLHSFLPILGESSSFSVDYVRLHQSKNGIYLESIYALNHLRDKLTMQFHHELYENLTVGWYFRFQKRMGEYNKYENGGYIGKRHFPGFSTLDMKVNYRYSDFNFNITINNVYDTDYFDIGNVPQPGFWLVGGVSYTIR